MGHRLLWGWTVLALGLSVQSSLAHADCGKFMRGFLPRAETIVAREPGRGGSHSLRSFDSVATYSNAKDLQRIFMKFVDLDAQFMDYRLGGGLGELDMVQKQAGSNTSPVFRLAFFDIIERAKEEKMRITVCGSVNSPYAITIHGLNSDRQQIKSVAQSFLDGDRIDVAGVRVWPEKDSKQ